MCGIAGILDLTGHGPVPEDWIHRMNDALAHRGPDDEGVWTGGPIALGSRRLAVVDPDGGHQPVSNKAGTVTAVFNGELFEHRALRRDLQSRGYRSDGDGDTALIPHLWDAYGERVFEHLKGQFAFALWDARQRRLLLARDRFGVLPLYWTHQKTSQGEWLLFASEIKALLASGLLTAAPDLNGINQVFHFLAVPGPSTCFAGVRLLQPGHWMIVEPARPGVDAQLTDREYWRLDFPARGEEEDDREQRLVDRLDEVLVRSVERRLRADVPVVSYLSGGVDSSIISAMAARVRGQPVPLFSVQITSPRFDESRYAAAVARHLGADATFVRVNEDQVTGTYPALIAATEAPVIDTASAASLLLAAEVRRRGFKVTLAGEGSDEWLSGYPWDKIHKLLRLADLIPGAPLGPSLRMALATMAGAPPPARRAIAGLHAQLGHYAPFHDLYALLTAARFLLLNDDTLTALRDCNPYHDLHADLTRAKTWDPLNQSAFWASRIHLPGHLLSLKGDRVAMRSSIETRYPFLDEDVCDFLARLHPRWKLRGFRDKYLLRRVAERYLPPAIAWRRKAMFRAPSDSFFARNPPAYVDQLLSEASLRRTGWFRIPAVRKCQQQLRDGTLSFRQKTFVELGMVGVVATQLWYQTFIDDSLADLPASPSGREVSNRRTPASAASRSAQPASLV